MRFRTKIVQSTNSNHDAGERGGNRGRTRVGKVRLAVDVEVAKLGLESALGLGDGTAEGDPIASASDPAYAEALRLEPVGDLLYVTGAKAEAVTILLGR